MGEEMRITGRSRWREEEVSGSSVKGTGSLVFGNLNYQESGSRQRGTWTRKKGFSLRFPFLPVGGDVSIWVFQERCQS